jgi:hypothetical protein
MQCCDVISGVTEFTASAAPGLDCAFSVVPEFMRVLVKKLAA